MKKYLLSLDDGGTYIKAAIHDFSGRQLKLTKEYNEVLIPQSDWTEYNQGHIWEINCTCIKRLIAESGISPEEIACIGISAQGHGCYMLDENGENIRNAICSSDGRSKNLVKKWNESEITESAYGDMYHHVAASHANSILAWLKENEPENYKKIAHLFVMKDLLVYYFTGNYISSYGCQSSNGLFDMNSLSYSENLAEKFGISGITSKFGPQLWDIQIAGYVTDKAASECGLVSGIPVAAGSHDVVASAIAMGVTDSKNCFMITGTHGINGYISDSPIKNGTVCSSELFAEPGKFLIEEGYPSSSGTLEWVISVLYADDKRNPNEIYDEINSVVESINPEDSDLIFMPYLRGSRDDSKAEGVWLGLKPFHTRSHMLLALYEGVVFSHMIQMSHLFMNREVPELIKTAGGATRSSVWMQMFADALQIPLEIMPDEEMGVKGASIVAATAAGIYPDLNTAVEKMTSPGTLIYPREDKKGIYQKKFEYFKKAYGVLRTLWS